MKLIFSLHHMTIVTPMCILCNIAEYGIYILGNSSIQIYYCKICPFETQNWNIKSYFLRIAHWYSHSFSIKAGVVVTNFCCKVTDRSTCSMVASTAPDNLTTAPVSVKQIGRIRDHFEYGLSQWETTLQGNVVSQWLSPYPEWSMRYK